MMKFQMTEILDTFLELTLSGKVTNKLSTKISLKMADRS